MSLNLSTPIDKLKSVGPRNASRLRRLGITTVRHLLWHLPSRYEDYSQRVPIRDIQVGTKVTVQGEVVKVNIKRIFPRRMTIVEAIIQDETGGVRGIWFNQPYIATALPEGAMVSLAGKVQLNKRGVFLSSPSYERLGTKLSENGLRHTAGFIPIYPETHGVTSKYLRFLIQPLVKDLSVEDPLPPALRSASGLLDLQTAIKTIHYPAELADVDAARQRLAFDDLLLFQLKALVERRKVHQSRSHITPFEPEFIKKAISDLPFMLTKDQKIAAWEILSDLEKTYPMNRLLEGDVGSGKTVVAYLAALQVAHHGFQVAYMAPTEVLAYQHYRTMQSLAGKRQLHIALLTSASVMVDGGEVSKIQLKKKIAAGDVDLVIGTHAIIQKDVMFKSLALVIVDEQHRFGIAQRAALVNSASGDSIPHLLSMTATPIPRTLALTIFGDLDISLIREKPQNRKEITTAVVQPSERMGTYSAVDAQIEAGRQVFVICPRISVTQETDTLVQKPGQKKLNLMWAEVKAVTDEFEKLSKEIFSHRRVVMLHGKMKPKEKQAVMQEFKDGWHDILVATSVIEVGVDIPNATVMVIENADRFGLAQLHQFRGRVGRAEHQSFCYLLQTTDDATVHRRLRALVDSSDGFSLAEKDMTMRGPGEFFGIKQSGMPDLTMAALADMDLIKKARAQARLLLRDDPQLAEYPLLKQRLEEFQALSHFE